MVDKLYLRWSDGKSTALPFLYDGRPDQLQEKLDEYHDKISVGTAYLHVYASRVWLLPSDTYVVSDDGYGQYPRIGLGGAERSKTVVFFGKLNTDEIEAVIKKCQQTVQIWGALSDEPSHALRSNEQVWRDDLRVNLIRATDDDYVPTDQAELRELCFANGLALDYNMAYPRGK